jgi:hypothetical protein
MKTPLIQTSVALLCMSLLTGCALSIGSGSKTDTRGPTVGQQLVDLKKARDAGAITDSEYEAQKAKILAEK